MLPDVARSNPERQYSKVDFPLPEGPTIPVILPGSAWKSTWSRMVIESSFLGVTVIVNPFELTEAPLIAVLPSSPFSRLINLHQNIAMDAIQGWRP